jgi:hypothetical protein
MNTNFGILEDQLVRLPLETLIITPEKFHHINGCNSYLLDIYHECSLFSCQHLLLSN